MEIPSAAGDVRILVPEAVKWSQFLERRITAYSAEANDRLNGWLSGYEDGRIVVRSAHQLSSAQGASFLFQVFASKHDLLFVGKFLSSTETSVKVAGQTAYEILFAIAGAIRRVPANRNARRGMYGLRATLEMNGEPIEVSLEDVSATGVGLLGPRELPLGQPANLIVKLQEGDIHLSLKVVNSHPANGSDDFWRVGATVEACDRVSNALWMKIVA